MRLDKLNIPWGRGAFRRTKRISLELSNLCNHAGAHSRCPAHFQEEPAILPEAMVDAVLSSCRAHDFQGVISFHLYNEPGIDPRLFLFMKKARKALPAARLYLLTNGWYLDQTLAREFETHGLDVLGISVYSEKERSRLSRLRLNIPVRIMFEPHDDRVDWYDGRQGPGCGPPCYCPLYEVCITCKGEVCLCPFDWQRQHVFGNLRDAPLEVILERPEVWRLYEALSSGNRELAICRGCTTFRGEPWTDDAGASPQDMVPEKKS
jgi:MoaA/NifB/PqqE/SkfB family radical SAM enzyme